MYGTKCCKTLYLRVLITIGIILLLMAQCLGCPRDKCRIARAFINQNFYSLFEDHGYTIPRTCVLHPGRDMYLDNELHKEGDGQNKWGCNYCGKIFVYEHWLDRHFDNRHSNRVYQGADMVCISDHCDYLRCDVLSGAKKPSYWEQALCKQPDLDKLKKTCDATMKSCLPDSLTGMKRHEFLDKLKKSMCSSLTCDKYWENPMKSSSSHTTVVYIVVSCLLVIGLLLYYLVAYTHFYSDHSLLTESDGLIRHKLAEEDQHYMYAPEGSHMRNRGGYALSGT